jgi:hypothetical protein
MAGKWLCSLLVFVNLSVAVKHCRISDIIESIMKHKILNIMNMCLYALPYLSHMQKAFFWVALYCHPWPVRLYHIFPYYFKSGTIRGGKKY